MKKATILFALLSLGFSACDDSKNSTSGDAGETCDLNAYRKQCSGNVILACEKSNVYINRGSVKETNCSEVINNGRCVDFGNAGLASDCNGNEDCDEVNSDTSAVSCISSERKCDIAGETFTECRTSVNGNAIIYEYKCTKTVDGSLYYRKTGTQKCHDGYGVCSESGECLPPVPCEYETHCVNDTLYRCDDGLSKTVTCSTSILDGICVEDETGAACKQASDKCKNEGDEIISSCEQGRELVRTCEKAPDGRLYLNGTATHFCLAGCNDTNTACKAYSCDDNDTEERCRETKAAAYLDYYTCQKNEKGTNVLTFDHFEKCVDKTCDESGGCQTNTCTTSYCIGNTAHQCNNGKMRERECSSNYNCEVIDGEADCYWAYKSNLCTEEGAVKQSCSSSKTTTKMCKMAESGTMYWVTTQTDACEHGCNIEKTQCAESACSPEKVENRCRMSSYSAYIDKYQCLNGVLEKSASDKCDSGLCNEDGTCVPVESCDRKEYPSHCEGDTSYRCLSGVVHVTHCDKMTTPKACEVVDGTAKCVDK